MLGGKFGLAGKLRELAYRQLEGGSETDRPLVKRVREVANTVNDLLGKPIHGGPDAGPDLRVVPTAAVKREQAPVIVYFDGKDHRTMKKVEELLRGRNIEFRVLDVANDEAERSWVVTAAKSEEFPIVVVAGTPLGGFHEVTQLDVQGELTRRVFVQQ